MLSLSISAFSQPIDKQRQKALKIHEEIFTVDSHTDTPLNFQDAGFNLSKDNSITDKRSCVDLPRMKMGGLDAVFFAVFISQGPRTPEGHLKAYHTAVTIFDSIDVNLKRYENQCSRTVNSQQAYKNEKSGKRSIFIGVENGYPIGHELSNINYFYQRGARYITLCHTRNNDICSSSTDTANTKGLSDFGIKVVERMNQLGMMIDVSHASDQSFYDILKVSKTPVIASHSCARALCDNPRNLTDDMLKAIASNGGVVQMCILSAYVKTPEANPARDSVRLAVRTKYNNFQDLSEVEMEKARHDWWQIEDLFPQKLAFVKDAVDHIDHMVKIAGIDHVGIGTDFDGGGGLEDCKDAASLGNITFELVKRGYSKSDIKKIWGANLMRVMDAQEKYSKSIAKT